MKNLKIFALGVAILLLTTGCMPSWVPGNQVSDEPTGPGSGDEIPDGPGSEEFYVDQYNDEVNKANEVATDEATSPCSEECQAGLREDEATGPGSGEEVKIMGSCNTIDDASTCIEYTGSFWQENVISLGCQGVGIFSKDACPRPMVGGCLMNMDANTEMTSYFYGYGGDPLLPDNVKNAAGACGMSGGTWIQ